MNILRRSRSEPQTGAGEWLRFFLELPKKNGKIKNEQKKLRIWETICTFANDIYKEMEQTVFELELLEEAKDFLKS